MGAVIVVDFVLGTLMELPPEALPGEDRAEAIRELLTASAYREVEAAGEEVCRAATSLVAKVVDRLADDADADARLAEADDHRPC